MNFKIGDIVSWGGYEGTVIDNPNDESVLVKFGTVEEYFYQDGKYRRWHKESSLVLVSRPKKKVMKRYWLWDIKNSDGIIFKCTAYRNEEGLCTNKKPYGNVTLIKKHEKEFIIEIEEE